jgi:hypothetical protein
VAEVEWGDLLDRQDGLYLLAAVCRGLAAEGLEDYRPPSGALAEVLAAGGASSPPLARGPERVAQVAAVVAAFGGEAG